MSDQAPEESRGAMRWVVLALMALIIFANYYLYDCFSTLKGTLQTDLGATSTQWGLIRNFYNVPNTFLFMALLGGGVRWFMTQRMLIRADAFITMNQLETPAGFLDPERALVGVGEKEWVSGPAFSIGAAFHF